MSLRPLSARLGSTRRLGRGVTLSLAIMQVLTCSRADTQTRGLWLVAILLSWSTFTRARWDSTRSVHGHVSSQWLRVPARDQQKSERWKDLCGAVQLAALPPNASPHVISVFLANALREVVKGAGGWEPCAANQRPAFESTNVRRTQNTAALLGKCSALICVEQAVGSFSDALPSAS